MKMKTFLKASLVFIVLNEIRGIAVVILAWQTGVTGPVICAASSGLWC